MSDRVGDIFKCVYSCGHTESKLCVRSTVRVKLSRKAVLYGLDCLSAPGDKVCEPPLGEDCSNSSLLLLAMNACKIADEQVGELNVRTPSHGKG